MKKLSKVINIRVFIYAFLVWLNLNILGGQKLFFSDGPIVTVIVVKILHLILLYAIVTKIHTLFTHRHIPKVKKEIIISTIYFIITMLLLILVWPGLWSTDDASMVKNSESYSLTPWQHFFSGLFQILCLQTIPIPSGVIVVQAFIASLIVGYCISNLSSLYGKTKKQELILEIILFLILLLPPLISHILSGYRMGMYSYIELALITELIIIYKKQDKMTLKMILKTAFLLVIISCWRTEGLYYPLIVLILFFIMGNKVISKRIATVTILIIMIINVSVGKINNYLIDTNDNIHNPTMKFNNYNNPIMKSNNYSITATMEPMTQLIKICDESDREELETINKVIDVEFILENPENSGEKNFWTEGVVKEFSNEEYVNYLKAYLKLVIKYPNVTLKSMWDIFKKAGSGFGEDNKQTTRNAVGQGTLKLFEIGSGTWKRWSAITSKVSKYKEPINLEVRNKVINFLNGTDSNGNLTIIHKLCWNLFIPFALMLICLIYKLIKKDWFMVFIMLAVSVRIPLVFVTSPAPYFMYYLSAYLCSYIISAIVILEAIFSRFNKSNDSNQLIVYKKGIKQFLSFFLVSGIGWIMDFSIYFALTHFVNLNVGLANVFSSIPAITYVFLISNKKIFKNLNSKLNLKIKYLIYFGYQLILLFSVSLLGEFLYNWMVNWVSNQTLLNNLKVVIKILITPITMTINFIVMKNLIEKL